MKKTAIVLSGGGSCGAYQIGVWKALRKLNIDYQIVTGVSVGALNGLMMVQNDYHKAYKLWSHLDYDLIFKDFVSKNDKKLKDKDIYLKYVDVFFKSGGMDISNLELVLNNVFDANKFYKSPIDYGIMVYNLTKMRSESFTKETLTQDKLKDYVIASATCFPAFKVKNIDDQKYIDGGYGDNLPLNLAIELGANKIIAVDLEQIGLKKRLKNKNIDITYIKPYNNIGSFLIFDEIQAKKNIKYGYNDTLKNYGVLRGTTYTFFKFGYDNFVKKIDKKLKEYVKHLGMNTKKGPLEKAKNKIVKKMLNIDNINVDDFINKTTTTLGKVLDIDDTKIYFIYQFNIETKRKFRKVSAIDFDSIDNKIKNNKISSLLGTKYIVKYIYEKLKASDNTDLSLLYTLFKNEFLTAIYLLCIK